MCPCLHRLASRRVNLHYMAAKSLPYLRPTACGGALAVREIVRLSESAVRCLVRVGTHLADRTRDLGGGGCLLPFFVAHLPFCRVATPQSHGGHHKLPNGRVTGVWVCVAAANIRTPRLVPARGVRGLNWHEYAYGIPPVHESPQAYPVP